jgi:quinol monooxygenase YgiN
MTIALSAEFTATPGNEARVAALIGDFAVAVRAEPGNLLFEPHHPVGLPGSVFVYESYRDRAAFEEHLTSAHGHEFNRRLADLVVGGGSRLTMLSPIAAQTAAPADQTPNGDPA